MQATETDKTNESPLALGVVGHANTGKTSLIRTLLRHSHFGRVENAMGTTRHVEMASLLVEGQAVVRLYDTPGLEDSMALKATLDSLPEMDNQVRVSRAHTGRAKLVGFIEKASQFPEFEQEIKVIKQALHSDVLLYVVDVREPVLGKYRDEIAVLSMAGIPIIPVFNFIAIAKENLAYWQTAMAEFNLHAVVAFDTVAFDFEAEKRLYQKLQSVLEARYDFIQQLIDHRLNNWRDLQKAAAQIIAELVIDVACLRILQDEDDEPSHIQQGLIARVQQAEKDSVRQLLDLFEFSDAELEIRDLPIKNGEWHRDLLEPKALKALGLSTSSAAATGAVLGAGVDLALAGISLGVAAATGAALGAGLSTLKRFGKDMLAKVKGQHWLCVDDATLTQMLLRQQALLSLLLSRGHAAQGRIQLAENLPQQLPKDWPRWLKTLRQHPEWSSLSHGDLNSREREVFVVEMGEGIGT